ncbi:hypothetical protein J2S77_002868 [Alkalibacillus salilacus]|uniref:Uncharacterized protein n=1 Tax=Alkalibacillus salilacus TaxID=284582 RepID=A0ABT9VIR3_9BACI|nr:hypothetical protein [Alkalibacillus salilacus]
MLIHLLYIKRGEVNNYFCYDQPIEELIVMVRFSILENWNNEEIIKREAKDVPLLL